MEIRPIASSDEPHLRRMLYLATFWDPEVERPSIEEALREPELVRYIDGWGRSGDAGVLAADDEVVGAAWFRLFGDDEPGYGFVSAEIPEISIAVDPSSRGHGIGTSLLSALIDRARAEGFGELSLSVAMRNPAKRLYERFGFRGMRGRKGTITMVLRGI